MTTHLLSLADLHSAAPGVLDVIFGPDGDFPHAPNWRGPVRCIPGPDSGFPIFEEMPRLRPGQESWYEWYALDLRIPSVAARIAALIQQVGGDTGDDMMAESVVNSLDNPRAIAELAPALAAHFRDPIILARIAALRRTP